MSNAYAKVFSSTDQSVPVPGKDQVVNNAGGYVFAISKLAQLRRFLILGTEGGTYYAFEQKLTVDNAKNLLEVLKSDEAVAAVKLIAKVSTEGLAPKVSPALFALACAFTYGTRDAKRVARNRFMSIVRTQSHMMEFVSYVDDMRGWGRILRETVANWYTSTPVDKLAYQMAKYRNRNGWTTKDVLRMCHPKPLNDQQQALFAWAVGKDFDNILLPQIAFDHVLAMMSDTPDLGLIKKGLTHEMIPNTWLNDPKVWEALLPNMPLTAMIRNLAKMTTVGLIAPLSDAIKVIENKLSDAEYIQKSRVHPFSLLLASSVYKRGLGIKGNLTWKPEPRIVAALDKAFYLSFKNVEPTGKRFYLALDVSGSMGAFINNSYLTCAQAAGAFAMAVAKTELNYYCAGFGSAERTNWGATVMRQIDITPSTTLDSLAKKMKAITFGDTDCSLPMIDALERKIPVDVFVVFTDNETWAGKMHPFQALKDYRKKMNRDAKLIVMGMTSTGFSIADPSDPGMLDLVGLDSSAPQLISNFVRDGL